MLQHGLAFNRRVAHLDPTGLAAAPLFYAYAKKELQAAGWV